MDAHKRRSPKSCSLFYANIVVGKKWILKLGQNNLNVKYTLSIKHERVQVNVTAKKVLHAKFADRRYYSLQEMDLNAGVILNGLMDS